jgi:hypothetical protein
MEIKLGRLQKKFLEVTKFSVEHVHINEEV